MKRIKVMHLLPTGLQFKGGMENGVINLIKGLDPDRYELSVCVLRDSGSVFQRYLGNNSVKFFPVAKKKEGFDYSLFLRLARLFRQEKIDILHSHNWGTLFHGVLGAKFAAVPVIIHGEHGKSFSDLDSRHRARDLARRILYRHLDVIVTVSQQLRDEIIQTTAIDATKVIAIANGVDSVKFRPEPVTRQKVAQFGINDQDVVLGTVGRIDPIKDYPSLLRGAAPLINCHSNFKVLIVGDSYEKQYRQELTDLAKELGIQDRLIITGWREDVPDLLKTIDIFILPSLSEGMSNTILEAMACGKPVVATRVGSNGQLVDNGTTGLLVPPADPETLSQAIMRLALDKELSHQMGEAGRRKVTEEFSLSQMVSKFENLYSALYERKLRSKGIQ